MDTISVYSSAELGLALGLSLEIKLSAWRLALDDARHSAAWALALALVTRRRWRLITAFEPSWSRVIMARSLHASHDGSQVVVITRDQGMLIACLS